MNDDYAMYVAACAAGYHDTRRDAVMAALGTLHRIKAEDAIDQYVEVLRTNRKNKGGENVDGRNSHAANTRLVLRKLLLKTLKVEYLDQLTDTVVRRHVQTSALSPRDRDCLPI